MKFVRYNNCWQIEGLCFAGIRKGTGPQSEYIAKFTAYISMRVRTEVIQWKKLIMHPRRITYF